MPLPILLDDDILNKIENSLRNLALRDIKEIGKLNTPIASFILCTCFIDQLSGFRYNSKKMRYRFEKFVDHYLEMYYPKKLCSDLRNKLVHNFSLGESYVITQEMDYAHNRQNKKGTGTVLLNLSNFIQDLEDAFNVYMLQLRTDPECRNNALLWFKEHNIISS